MKILLTIPHECLDEARGKNLYESYFYENVFKKILVVISYKFFKTLFVELKRITSTLS